MAASELCAKLFGLRFLVFSILVARSLGQRRKDDSTQYCEREVFEAKCSPGEVIVMQSALYGRMASGRCIAIVDESCVLDAMHILNDKCSGRRECTIPVASIYTMLHQKLSCMDQFRSYLEAEYTCLQVAQPKDRECARNTVATLRGSSGYLSSHEAHQSGAGSLDCPWLIKVTKGRKIRIWLIDFAKLDAHDYVCHIYAYIKESRYQTRKTVCGKQNRNSTVYTSQGSSVELNMQIRTTDTIEDTTPFYVFKYEVTGCADLVAPSGGWLKRDEDSVRWGCDSDDVTRTVQCVGDAWNDVVLNCTEAVIAAAAPKKEYRFGDLMLKPETWYLLGGAVTAILLGICLLTIGIYFIRKYRKPPVRRDPTYGVYYGHNPEQCVCVEYSKGSIHSSVYNKGMGDYSHEAATLQLLEHRPQYPQRDYSSLPHNKVRMVAPPTGNHRPLSREAQYESLHFDRNSSLRRSDCSDEAVPPYYFELDPETVAQMRLASNERPSLGNLLEEEEEEPFMPSPSMGKKSRRNSLP